MGIAVLAVGFSGPLIASMSAPALAVAFWRNALGALATAPYTLRRQRPELLRLRRREAAAIVAAGAFLALHFATWISSLRLTSVASSVALAATTPLWAACIARVRGERVERRTWAGVAISLGGVLVLTGIDRSTSSDRLLGDLLALLGGLFAAVYMTIGAGVRQEVSNATYTTLCYGACALLVLPVIALAGLPLAGYSASTWLKLVLLTASAQLLGHTLFNHVLKTTSAAIVSLAILLEVPLAAVIAALWLRQHPPLAALPAAAAIVAGLAVVVGFGGRVVEDTTTPVD